jgi:hypothetical protein
VPVYYAGDTPQGVRLYREFTKGDAGAELLTAVARAVEGTPQDSDYRTLWPTGSAVAGASVQEGTVQVDIDGAPHDLPAGMTGDQAALAIQQVVYSAQGALGEGRVPVQLLLGGEPSDRILGQPTGEALTNAPQLDVLAHVNITSPEQGEEVRGMLVASGVASSFEGTVPLKVMRGDEVVLEDFATADGWMGKLFPWQKSIDVAALPPGDYTLVASTDDPSGGVEGAGPHTDTKDFTLAG